MFIHSAFSLRTEHPADVRSLKERLRLYSAYNARRLNRFILLALIGAHGCLAGKAPDGQTGVYLTTERGNLGDTETVLREIYEVRGLPMPIGFIHTMSNTATFHVACSLGLAARNLTLSSQGVSFERGLELLQTDMSLGIVSEALLGEVDEAMPFAVSRTGADPDAPFRPDGATFGQADREGGPLADRQEGPGKIAGDVSGWFHLNTGREGALGECLGVFTVPIGALAEPSVLPTRLRDMMAAESPTVVFAPPVERDLRVAWHRCLSFGERREGSPAAAAASGPGEPAASDGEALFTAAGGGEAAATSAAVGRFLAEGPSPLLIHVNRDPCGQLVLLCIRRF